MLPHAFNQMRFGVNPPNTKAASSRRTPKVCVGDKLSLDEPKKRSALLGVKLLIRCVSQPNPFFSNRRPAPYRLMASQFRQLFVLIPAVKGGRLCLLA
jgi:hypothetical protein